MKKLREQKLMSAEDLARKADLSVSAIYKIEKGLVNPQMNTKKKIVEAFGYKPEQAHEVFPS